MKNQILKLVLFIFVTALVVSSCQEDPLEGIVINDRQFLSFKIEGQVGPSIIKSIDEDSGTVELFALTDNIKLNSITPIFEVSEKASISPQKGAAVNFNNASKSFTYKIVSESGKTRVWHVKIKRYKSILDADWKVASLLYDWQIGHEFDWGWGSYGKYDAATGSYDPAQYKAFVLADDFPNAAFELDNTLKFKTNSINEKGNPEGTFSFGAGADKTFSSFILNPDHEGNIRDYSSKYRRMPKGDGVWEYNEFAKVITLWKGDKKGPEVKGNVKVDALGNISIAFDVEDEPYKYLDEGPESHILTGFTIYYNFEKDKI